MLKTGATLDKIYLQFDEHSYEPYDGSRLCPVILVAALKYIIPQLLTVIARISLDYSHKELLITYG